ncbi:MAG: leucine-rich repeat domain-containing protein [Oscillospiraceae bacterium]|nr:leucine-rich repeat domain-containing protein [Oscillospiraceae bacterium]
MEDLKRAAAAGDTQAEYQLITEYIKLQDYPNAIRRLDAVLAVPSHPLFEKANELLSAFSQEECFKIAEALYQKKIYSSAVLYYRKTIAKYEPDSSDSENSLKLKKSAEDGLLRISIDEKAERERERNARKKAAALRSYKILALVVGVFAVGILIFVLVRDSNDEYIIPEQNAEITDETESNENLKTVTINNNEYDINLTFLSIEWTPLNDSDMEQIALLKNLTELELIMCDITNINALKQLASLERLDLRFNEISDLSPLTNLTNLTELNVSNNNITDISALIWLSNLKELELGNNYITDLSPLYDRLPLLENLYIYGNEGGSGVTDSPFDEYIHGDAIRAKFPGCTIHF